MGLAKVPRPADLRRRISDITEEGRSRKRQKLIEEHNARPRVATQTFLEQSAVSPKTAADYKMRMDVFNMFCFLHKLTTLNLQTLDTALTIFLQQCFNDGMELNEATKFLAAIMDARPEASARHLLPRARRSLKGWKNLDPGRSRPPIPWPLITLIVNSMLQRHQLISAMMILTMFVTYCRPFELLLLEKRDLISTKTLGMAWSLNLNKAEVMETSKMGVQDESMLLDSQEVPWLGKALMAFNKKMMQSPKMFPQDYYTLMKHWKKRRWFTSDFKRILRSPINFVTPVLRGIVSKNFGLSWKWRWEVVGLQTVQWQDTKNTHFSVKSSILFHNKFKTRVGRQQQTCEIRSKSLWAFDFDETWQTSNVSWAFLWMQQRFGALGYRAEAWDIMFGEECDLTKVSTLNSILHRISTGEIFYTHMGLPCNTWSRARRNDGRGPGPLRDDSKYLFGLPNLSSKDRQKVRQGNILLRHSIQIIRACQKHNVLWSLENPMTSRVWKVRALQQLRNSHHVRADFCQWNLPWRKSTYFFMHQALQPQFRVCTGYHGVCSKSNKPHILLQGSCNGQFLTKLAEPYPFGLVNQLVKCVLNVFRKAWKERVPFCFLFQTNFKEKRAPGFLNTFKACAFNCWCHSVDSTGRDGNVALQLQISHYGAVVRHFLWCQHGTHKSEAGCTRHDLDPWQKRSVSSGQMQWRVDHGKRLVVIMIFENGIKCRDIILKIFRCSSIHPTNLQRECGFTASDISLRCSGSSFSLVPTWHT